MVILHKRADVVTVGVVGVQLPVLYVLALSISSVVAYPELSSANT